MKILAMFALSWALAAIAPYALQALISPGFTWLASAAVAGMLLAEVVRARSTRRVAQENSEENGVDPLTWRRRH